ncbi:MAG: flagellar basal body-associated FliL family protein [Syntrophobacterales bacterium]|nr:flagellar basal body-associated FliL family protein [Syntrophobacterales bacterium]
MISHNRFVAGYYKRVLMAVCLCVAVFVGGQGSGIGDQRPEARGQELCEERFEYFNNFIVHLKGSSMKDRLLICDVVIELNQGMKLPEEKVELRKIIYKTLKELSGPPEIRGELKRAIRIRLNNFMDDEILKGVYFTRFILL